MAGSQVSQQATPSTPALAAAEVSTGAMAEKLGTGYSAADIVEPDVVNQPAAQPGATGPGIGDRYPSQRVRGVNSGDRPALRALGRWRPRSCSRTWTTRQHPPSRQ